MSGRHPRVDQHWHERHRMRQRGLDVLRQVFPHPVTERIGVWSHETECFLDRHCAAARRHYPRVIIGRPEDRRIKVELIVETSKLIALDVDQNGLFELEEGRTAAYLHLL